MSTKPPVQNLGIPPELQRSLPREVSLTGSGIASAVLAALMTLGAFIAGPVLFVTGQRQAVRFAAERADSVTATATVTNVRRIPGKDDRWRVYYAFQIGEDHYNDSANLQHSAARQFHAGSVVNIQYVQSDPNRSWIVGHEPKPIPVFVPIIISASLLLGGGLLFWGVQRQRGMLERGRAAIGRVTTTRWRRRHNRRTTFYVYYEFTTYSGAVQKGRGSGTKQQAPAAGSEIVVLYDMDNPKRTAWYPLPMVRVRER
jgi:hypothetical protein